MPRLFIDFVIGDLVVVDEEGMELPDQVAAETEARAVLLEEAKRRLGFDKPLEMTATIRDDTSVLHTTTLHVVCLLVSRPSG